MASERCDTHRVQVLFAAIVATIAIAAGALIWVHQFVSHRALPSSDLIIDAYKAFVSPKPTEQFVFVILAGLTPIVAYAVALSRFETVTQRLPACSKVMPLLMAAALYGPLVASAFISVVIGEYDKPRIHGVVALIASTVAAALMCYGYVSLGRWRARSLQASNLALVSGAVVLCAAILQMAAWRLVSVASVTRSGVWSTHADPVFYALSQVVSGKTLMVDLPSQYGLFPEMIAPLFKWIGLSVFKLSAFFAVMQLGSLAALYYVLSRTVKVKPLLVVTGVALVMLTFETTLYVAGIDERYYQYWPTRFFWPALSVLAFYRFSIRRTLVGSGAMSLIGAIGLLWNLDSGIFITIVFAAYLVARLISIVFRRNVQGADTWSAKQYAAAIALHVAITVVVIGAFLAFMAWKAQAPLNLFWLVEYQRIFYNLGLMMLPLPRRIDPWMSVLGMYLVGMLSSITAWRRRGPRAKDDTIFYLSMLGLGLFVYYEGRSHVLNLVTVCWPAVILVAMLGDESLRAIRARLLPMPQVGIPIAATAFLLVACGSFVYRVPDLAREAGREFRTKGIAEEPFVQNEIEFIRTHASAERECLILSQRQGIYYAETGLSSPVRGPGFVEILLKADERRLLNAFLEAGLPCVFYGIGGYTDPGFKIPMTKILARYDVAARNSENTMLYLRAKP